MSKKELQDRTDSILSSGAHVDRLPTVLSLIAGLADVTSWLALGGLFSAHVTGNLVTMAGDLFRGQSPHPAEVLAVPVFIIAVAAADEIAWRADRKGKAVVRLLLILQSILLLAVLASSVALHPTTQPYKLASTLIGMLAISAMAVQNALLHLSRKQAPTTAVMTGNLVVCTIALVELLRRDSDHIDAKKKWHTTWPILTAFLAGCLIGSLAFARMGAWSWAIPSLLSLVLAFQQAPDTSTQSAAVAAA